MSARCEADPTRTPPRELKRGSRGACRVDTSLEVRMSSPVHRERGSVVRSARPIARRRARRGAARACKSGGTTFTRRREGASEARCGFWYTVPHESAPAHSTFYILHSTPHGLGWARLGRAGTRVGVRGPNGGPKSPIPIPAQIDGRPKNPFLFRGTQFLRALNPTGHTASAARESKTETSITHRAGCRCHETSRHAEQKVADGRILGG